VINRFDWKIAPCSWAVAESIASELGLPLVVGAVLARRGFTSAAEARGFLEAGPEVPDPFLMTGMEAAAVSLEKAIKSGRRIVVHGDYDADGLSATALMALCLRELGGRCDTYIPHRFQEGYGLSEKAVRAIAAEGDALLVTVDCGVNYPAEVALALQLGLDVVVTDHHEPGDVLPACPVIHQQLGEYPGPDLCGVGIALKTLHALHVRMRGAERTRLPQDLASYLDIVALGTIADIVPLRAENRYYVQEGLKRLAWSERPGLRALARVAGGSGPADAATIAFRLAPRINAAGRMSDPNKALRLLLTDDETEAAELALELHELNLERQATEREIMAQAEALIEEAGDLPHALVLSHDDWHEGVVGIVASRLVEQHHRPVVLLACREGRARGSARSIPAYDLMEGLRSCTDLLLVFGGHAQAAGLTLMQTDIEAFAERLDHHAASVLQPADLVPMFTPDAVVCGDELTLDTAEALARLAPFGHENEPVRLIALGVSLDNPSLTRTGDHLRCSLKVDGVHTRGIGFRFGPAVKHLEEVMGSMHAAFELEVHEWNGFSRPEIRLHSLYETPDRGESALGCSPWCPFLDDPGSAAPCAHCADPFSELPRALPIAGRASDGRGPTLSGIAQILSFGEPTALICSSVSRRLRTLVSGLPLTNLGVTGVDCVSRLCWRSRAAELRSEALLFLDWPAALRRSPLLAGKRHLLVIDPPYSPSHTHVLRQAADQGALVHFLYGSEERRFTADMLKLMLHPRHDMIGLYRTLRDTPAADRTDLALLFRRTAERMWGDHSFLPAYDELALAWRILEEMGINHGDQEDQHLRDPADVSLFREAEALYREAVESCRTL
jgi:single-stranded-DNA-specific exonuclease